MAELTTDMEGLAGALPSMDDRDQRLALTLLRTLAKGEPVSRPALARAADLPESDVEAALARWPGVFSDDEERVVGFGGLAVIEMSHRFAVNGRQLWTWCAWDTLFLPELLDEEAHVSSPCPVTGEEITLTVGPAGPRDLHPPGAAVSFLVPDRPFDATIVQSFCHFVHFFASREAGARWTAENEGTFLLTVEDAYELGRLTNRAQFGAVLRAGERDDQAAMHDTNSTPNKEDANA